MTIVANVTSVDVGVGLDITELTPNPVISLDLGEIAEKTGALAGTDRLVGMASGGGGATQFAETISSIPLGIFNNDQGWSATVGTVTDVTGGVGIDSTGGATPDITLDLGELTTGGTPVAGDGFVYVDNGTSRQIAISSVPLSVFNNNSNWTSNLGTVTSIATGDGIQGGTITTSGSISVDSTVLRTTGSQTISGAKTFTTDLTLTGSGSDIRIAADARIYFDGGTHTYITQEVGDRLDIVVGGVTMMQLTEAASDTVKVNVLFEAALTSTLTGNVGVGQAPGGNALTVREASSGVQSCAFNHAHASNPYGILFTWTADPDNNTNYFVNYKANAVTRAIHYSDGDWLNHDGSYGMISDARFKTNPTPARSQWDDVKALAALAINYQRVEDGPKGRVFLGWSAQDVRDAGMGGLVMDCDEHGKEFLGLRTSIAHTKATIALGEALVRIEDLERDRIADHALIEELQEAIA